MTRAIGRNAPCPCGSGKKYKQCCLRAQQLEPANAPEPPAPLPLREQAQPAPDPASGFYGSDEGMREWEAFWEAFDAASLDEQLAMARECILNEPHFDGEWAFSLFVEDLPGPIAEAGRPQGWFDLLSLFMERHPDVAAAECGPIGSKAVTIALQALEPGDDHINTALRLLFLAPAENIDYIAKSLESLAYGGVTAPLEFLREAWTDIDGNRSLMPGVKVEWADWTAIALLARWAEEDIDKIRTLEELQSALGPIARPLKLPSYEPLLTGFLGTAAKSTRASTTRGTLKNLETITLAYLRSLVDDHRWPPYRALLVARQYPAFLRYLRTVKDPFQMPETTRDATRSKALREELKHIRELRESEPFFTPQPDLAIGTTERILQAGFFGHPHVAAAFLQAVVHHSPWLHARGYLKAPETLDLIQSHSKRRLPALRDAIVSLSPTDAGVHRNLDALFS